VKYGGLKFLDAAHVKDLLALLRFIENPRDRVAGFRVLQLIPGIGPAAAGKALDRIAEAADPLSAFIDGAPPPRAAEGWANLCGVVADLGGGRSGWPAELTRARLWYEPLMEERYEDAIVRREDIAQLEHIANGYPSRERFLTELTLDPPDAASDLSGPPLRDEDFLILSTIHSAKGQEWKAVHVLNVVDGAIPSDLGTGSAHELEEERRLLYVAMTRAKDQLHLLVPQRFYVHQQTPYGDRHVYAQRSRFITRAMLEKFEDMFWPPVSPAALRPLPQPAGPPVDIGARMRGMWAAKAG
jgi:DNA helicase-2/ATP-dependent DNA helicase PcrA